MGSCKFYIFSGDTATPIPSKKWRPDKFGSDYRNSGNSYSNKDSYKDYSYNDPDYRLPSNNTKDSSRHKSDPDYEDYDDYDDGEMSSGYSNDRSSCNRDWKDDSYRGRYQKNSDRRPWDKGNRNDYTESRGGFRQNASQSSHGDSNKRTNTSSDYSYQNESRGGRFDRPSRSRRGSGFSRRPYGGRGSNNSDSYQGSRYSNQSDKYGEKDDDYYDHGSAGRDSKDEFYENKWDNDNRDDHYDSRYEGDDYYDDYQDDNSSNYGGSRGSRYQGRGRGDNSRGRRNSYGRGGTSWRGSRGKDQPRRPRGRGPRRGM